MSINTYSTLQSAIQSWLHRSDVGLTNRITDFITLAEAKFNRKLRTRNQETHNSSFSVSAQYESLPADFNEMRSIHISGDSGGTLDFMSLQDMSNRYPYSSTGVPKFFCITGSQIRFAPRPAGTYTAVLDYFANITPLSDSAPTNWLLTSHPDAYLYGALLEAAPFCKNPDLGTWAVLFKAVMVDIQSSDDDSKYSGPLMMRAG